MPSGSLGRAELRSVAWTPLSHVQPGRSPPECPKQVELIGRMHAVRRELPAPSMPPGPSGPL